MRVMVADDDPGVRRLLHRWFRTLGWRVEAFATGAQLVEAVRRDAPDLVLSDVQMPGSLDGPRACKAIRRENPGVGIILMTGDGSVVERLRRSGFGLVLSKPFALDQLEAAVAAGLRGSLRR